MSGSVYRAVAIVAAVLCAFVFWPGVVRQANLDARPINAAAAIGVLLTCVLVATARLTRSGRQPGDRARIAVAVPLVLVSLPWFAAELGFFFPRRRAGPRSPLRRPGTT